MSSDMHVQSAESGPAAARADTPISEAWRRLAQSGAAGRYSGRTPDGRHEVLLTRPDTGQLLATGRGNSVAQAICAAVSAVQAGHSVPIG